MSCHPRYLFFAVLSVTCSLVLACDNSLDCESADDCFSGEVCYEGSCVPESGNNGANDGGNNGGGDTGSDTGDDGGQNGTGIVEVSAGGLSTCARLTSGELRCWGRNLEGQLGTGETSNQELIPQTVEGLTNATQLESGHSNHCAFDDSAHVYCWGSNGSGQITPDEGVDKIATPTDLGVSPVASVAPADRAICVQIRDGAGMSCLGSDSDPVVFGVPSFEADVESLAGGFHHACAVLDTGEVQCWGQDNKGEVGGSVVVGNLPSIDRVALGFEHSCALSDSGTVYCWGSNESGQLGVGSSQRPSDAVRVDGLERVVDIDAGYSHTCALDADGAVVCWGSDTEGFSQPLPTGIFGLNQGVEMISVGSYHACALRVSGQVQCWGRNQEGQLGDGSQENSSRPVDVDLP